MPCCWLVAYGHCILFYVLLDIDETEALRTPPRKVFAVFPIAERALTRECGAKEHFSPQTEPLRGKRGKRIGAL